MSNDTKVSKPQGQVGYVKTLSGKRIPAVRSTSGTVTLLTTGRQPFSIRTRDSFVSNR